MKRTTKNENIEKNSKETEKIIQSKSSKIKRYQVWKGNHKIYFGGYCITGPYRKTFWVSFFAIIIPSFIFWCCLNIENKIYELIISIAITFISLFFMLKTTLMDPGIIMYNHEPPLDAPEGESKNIPRIHEIKGEKIETNYCTTCKLWRPLRSHHCSTCGVCVLGMDHHCVLVGNCVGIRNYPYFFFFLVSTFCVSAFAICVGIGMLLNNNLGTYNILLIIIVIYCCLICVGIGGLTVYHIYLLSVGQTTFENITKTSKKVWNEGFFSNFSNRVFVCQESNINLRENVSEEEMMKYHIIL